MLHSRFSSVFQGHARHLALGKLTNWLLFSAPVACLFGFWFGGETTLTFLAFGLPLLAVLLGAASTQKPPVTNVSSVLNALGPDAFEIAVCKTMETARNNGKKSAVFMLKLDDYDDMVKHYGAGAMDSVSLQVHDRLRSSLRSDDTLAVFDTATFAICLTPQSMFDLESCLELSGRLNQAVSEPYSIDGVSVYITSSIGFCQLGREVADTKHPSVDPVSQCAKQALGAAQLAAPSAIRAFSPNNPSIPKPSNGEELDIIQGLDNGEIMPWYQPQISTDTGKITGFEALARWIHPTRGPISPEEFLPLLENAGLMGRLSEVMLYNAMTALKAWDQAGVDVRQVGVNFSPIELNDPKLVEKIAWELDRFELSADRLAVEILETVVAAGPDDVITRNIKGLETLGCQIDLDDFGTGHASLASIRRFGVGRIKIDRSYVMKSDRDIEQQRMIRAILTLAEKLDIETLAEGVETVGEHSLLAQLGCTHVQGFGIARPMPFENTLSWIREHNAKLQDPPNIGRATG